MLPTNISAAQRFVALATTGERPSLGALTRCLDELALSYHDTPLGEPYESDERPVQESKVTLADIVARFPDFGYYGIADANEVPPEPMIGDAKDDIMDITNDLKEVLWRFQRFGPEDAHWHFRFLFQVHWGEHLRNLSRYLHSRLRSEEEQRY